MKKELSFNNKITIIFSLLIFLACSSAFAENKSSGIVEKVRGTVIASLKGKDVQLKKGDKVPAKTFLESQAKSFAIILFKDKTKLTLGPKSKIQVVNPSTDKQPGIINLLQGQIRNKITKPGKMNKYFVNTKAAAIGVRGTEFIAIYNSTTNSLTSGGFSGVVAIGPSIQGELNVDSANKAVQYGSKETIYLKAKHFSSIKKDGKLLKISAPRKMNPRQYHQLKNNPEPTFTENKPTIKKSDKKRTSRLPNISENVQNTTIEVTQSNSSIQQNDVPSTLGEKQQMPSGSFVDLNSGTIIPPPPGSEYDSNSGTFIIDKSFGSISSDGSYIPPEGVTINEKGKFEVAKTENSTVSTDYVKTLNKLVETAKNAESTMLNPTSKELNALNNSLTDNKNLKVSGNSDSKRNEAGTSGQAKPAAVTQELSLENIAEDSSDTSDSISMDLSCPGNICDKFDTVAPTSDEASQKTLVQFTIRVNKN
jgi:hypothetical protein